MGYNINPQARIFTEISWSRFSNDVGNTTIYHKENGERVKDKDSPGCRIIITLLVRVLCTDFNIAARK